MIPDAKDKGRNEVGSAQKAQEIAFASHTCMSRMRMDARSTCIDAMIIWQNYYEI